MSLGLGERTQGSTVPCLAFLQKRNINQLTLTINNSDLRRFAQLEILKQANSEIFASFEHLMDFSQTVYLLRKEKKKTVNRILHAKFHYSKQGKNRDIISSFSSQGTF